MMLKIDVDKYIKGFEHRGDVKYNGGVINFGRCIFVQFPSTSPGSHGVIQYNPLYNEYMTYDLNGNELTCVPGNIVDRMIECKNLEWQHMKTKPVCPFPTPN